MNDAMRKAAERVLNEVRIHASLADTTSQFSKDCELLARAALTEASQPVQEPVAWRYWWPDGSGFWELTRDSEILECAKEDGLRIEPLYTIPKAGDVTAPADGGMPTMESDAIDTLTEEGWIWDDDQWQSPPGVSGKANQKWVNDVMLLASHWAGASVQEDRKPTGRSIREPYELQAFLEKTTPQDMDLVAWGVFDSQGYYTSFDTEQDAEKFCSKYNEREIDPLKPYTFGPLYADFSGKVRAPQAEAMPVPAEEAVDTLLSEIKFYGCLLRDGDADEPDRVFGRIEQMINHLAKPPGVSAESANVLTPPHHPEPHTMAWTPLELDAIRAYGERCWCAGRSTGPQPPAVSVPGEAMRAILQNLVQVLNSGRSLIESTAGDGSYVGPRRELRNATRAAELALRTPASGTEVPQEPELPVMMTAFRHAWNGDKKAATSYVELAASNLGNRGKYLLDMLAVLKGEKEAVYIKAMEAPLQPTGYDLGDSDHTATVNITLPQPTERLRVPEGWEHAKYIALNSLDDPSTTPWGSILDMATAIIEMDKLRKQEKQS